MNLSQSCRWLPLLLPLGLAMRHARESVCVPQLEPTPLRVCVVPAPIPASPKAFQDATAQHRISQTEIDKRLMSACEKNDFRGARALLHRGADPNGREDDGFPLFFSFVNGSEPSQNRALSFLLEHGADANARDASSPSGTTPLMWAACMGGGARSIEILLAHGARIDDRDRVGQTALLDASSVCGGCGCTSNSEEGIALIKHGANVNAQDQRGNTPLLLMVDSGPDELEFARALLARGASISHRNKEGTDALQLAQQGADIYPEIFHLLQHAARKHTRT